MRVVIINQARMTSTRLPGKILKQVLDKPLLEYQIERLRRVAWADELVIATTVNDADQPIVDLCDKLGAAYYRGSEHDVLSRYYEAAQKAGAEAVVRVTSDCPLIDPGVVDDVIRYYIDNSTRYDYVSNIQERTFPRGMDVEVFPFILLEEACRKASKPVEREHVTPYICHHPERFRLGSVAGPENHSRHRWTVDQIEDFILIKNIIEALYPGKPQFDMQDVLDLLREHPDWIEINAMVEQKKI